MAQQTSGIGSTSGRGRADDGRPKRKKGLGWLWLLLSLLLVAAVILFLIVRNAGDDDPEGLGVSGQECPEYAGDEGRNETTEVAEDATPFFGCEVAVAGPIGATIDANAFILEAEQPGGPPIVVVRAEDADEFSVAEGDVKRVIGTVEESLDPAEIAGYFDGTDQAAFAEYEGRPYVSADEILEPR